MWKRLSVLAVIALFCCAGCKRQDDTSVSHPFPDAKEVRLFVEKDYGKGGNAIFARPEGRVLKKDEVSDFEAALRVAKAPEEMAACFIPHHFFRYFDGQGKEIGEIEVCFCCAGVRASKGANISIGSDEILAADYAKLEALVHRLGEPTEVHCD